MGMARRLYYMAFVKNPSVGEAKGRKIICGFSSRIAVDFLL
jgi:hypothetical protein